MLNDRSFNLIIRNVVQPRNYAALARVGWVYERPFAGISRYFFGGGRYPYSMRVRTPTGLHPVTLFGSQDAITMYEIFCREDYRCPSPPRVVVDLGANIGISALYFLTRSRAVYCELYEPDPRNLPKLLHNLRGYSGRFVIHETAVADREGVLPFRREPTGRYGRLETDSWVWNNPAGMDTEIINVRVEHVNTVLDQAISRHGVIDLLKIDTEGSELATLLAIEPTLRANVRCIIIECFEHNVKLDGFSASSSCDTITFTNENPSTN